MKTFRYVTGLPDLKKLKTEEGDKGRLYVTPSGSKLPSITTVLGHFKKKAIMEWRARVGEEEAKRISGRASSRGTKFHNMMEKYLRNDSTLFENVMPDMKQAFNDAKETVDKIDNIHYIETPFYSESLGVAGRTDVIAEYDGVLSIIDFKTSSREKKEEHITDYFEQATAYALMYEHLVGNPIDQIVIIMSSDGLDKPQLFIKNKENYIQNLLEKIHIYKEETKNVS
jgi:genome maintenance exonuclease 1